MAAISSLRKTLRCQLYTCVHPPSNDLSNAERREAESHVAGTFTRSQPSAGVSTVNACKEAGISSEVKDGHALLSLLEGVYSLCSNRPRPGAADLVDIYVSML